MEHPHHLTGKFKEFSLLFFPLLAISFSTCLFLLVEKILLARLSIAEMEAAVTVTYICQIFQITCIALTMMAQIFVARWRGAGQLKVIGPGIWQFIWFSLLSMLITTPIGFIYGNYFLSQTDIQKIAAPYFHFMLGVNFLYPLGTTLSCFYLGQGKTRLVLLSTVGSQIIKVALAYLLILGWEPWVPSLGLMGGAISTLIAQGGFCLLLFLVFLLSGKAIQYDAWVWKFQPKLFWECMKPGLLRAFNRILNVTCWASIAQLMATKEGDYLIVLSIGGALSLFLPFLSDAICQTQTIIVSQMIGATQYHLLNRSFFSGFSFSIFFIVLTSLPLTLFPQLTFEYLFPNVSLDHLMTKQIFLGVWVSFAFYTLGYMCVSYILAFKDMFFSLFMGMVNWINGFLLMYVALEKIGISAEQFWLVHSLMHGSTTVIYFIRARHLCSRAAASVRSQLTSV